MRQLSTGTGPGLVDSWGARRQPHNTQASFFSPRFKANTVARRSFSASPTSVARLDARCAADLPADSVGSLCAPVFTGGWALGRYRRDTPPRVVGGLGCSCGRRADDPHLAGGGHGGVVGVLGGWSWAIPTSASARLKGLMLWLLAVCMMSVNASSRMQRCSATSTPCAVSRIRALARARIIPRRTGIHAVCGERQIAGGADDFVPTQTGCSSARDATRSSHGSSWKVVTRADAVPTYLAT